MVAQTFRSFHGLCSRSCTGHVLLLLVSVLCCPVFSSLTGHGAFDGVEFSLRPTDSSDSYNAVTDKHQSDKHVNTKKQRENEAARAVPFHYAQDTRLKRLEHEEFQAELGTAKSRDVLFAENEEVLQQPKLRQRRQQIKDLGTEAPEVEARSAKQRLKRKKTKHLSRETDVQPGEPLLPPTGNTDAEYVGDSAPRRHNTRTRPRHVRQAAGTVQYDNEGVPRNFHWEEYLRLYPELRDHGIQDEGSAREHYRSAGIEDGRLHRMPRLYLQYTACTPVFEQLYSHMSAIVVGRLLAAEVILPPAITKDHEGQWMPVPLETILDVEKVIDIAADKYYILHQLPESEFDLFPRNLLWHGSTEAPEKDSAQYDPDTCWPRWRWGNTTDSNVLPLATVYKKTKDLQEFTDDIYRRIGLMGISHYRGGAPRDIEFEVVVNLPCTFFSIFSLSALGPMHEVAEMLMWPKELMGLAEKAVSLIKQQLGVQEFNGIVVMGHDDWLTWVTPKFPTVYYKYEKSMKAFFNTSLPCYFGIEDLVDVTARDMQGLQETVVKFSGVCTTAMTQYQLLGEDELKALHAEQHKLLDFLVLMEATKVIGHYKSLLALFLNEYRHLMYKGDRELVRVQTKIELGKSDLEIDKLSLGGLFTIRHASKIQDMPKLFLGANELKLQKIIAEQKANKEAAAKRKQREEQEQGYDYLAGSETDTGSQDGGDDAARGDDGDV